MLFRSPSYGFTLKTPRSWTVREGGDFGALLTFLPKEDDTLFRANANLVVEPKDPSTNLDNLAQRSVVQLQALLAGYRVLGQIPMRWGGLPAIEIRSLYSASEGDRILRTFLAVTTDFVYVLSITCRAEREAEHTSDFNAFVASFVWPAATR